MEHPLTTTGSFITTIRSQAKKFKNFVCSLQEQLKRNDNIKASININEDKVYLSMGGGAGVAAASIVLLTHVDLFARVSIFSKACPWSAGTGTVVIAVHVGALVLHIRGYHPSKKNILVRPHTWQGPCPLLERHSSWSTQLCPSSLRS